MKSITIDPTNQVNDVPFLCDRSEVRKVFGKKYSVIKKTPFSKNTTDVYDSFHIYYNADDKFEAIEIFGNVRVLVNDVVVFPGSKENIKKIFPEMVEDEYGLTDVKFSVGVTLNQDDEEIIDGILFGCKGYYE